MLKYRERKKKKKAVNDMKKHKKGKNTTEPKIKSRQVTKIFSKIIFVWFGPNYFSVIEKVHNLSLSFYHFSP